MTQAVNLANFANNLDSSGGLNPSALNAPVPFSKGGTNSSSAAAAAAEFGKLLYPVGSLYFNTSNSTNPGSLLGFGTWTVLSAGRMLMGAGGAYGIGTTGGSADATVVSHTHTATTNTTGAHTHTYNNPQLPSGGSTSYQNGPQNYTWRAENIASGSTGSAGDHSHSVTVNATGGSATDANLPPYLVVYMWQRTA